VNPVLVDCNIGGAVDGTPGGDADVVEQQATEAEALGFDGAWSTEVGRDPFLPLVVAARRTRSLTLGTGVAIAFARSPMTVASTAYDLQGLSGGRFVLGLGSQVKAHVTRRYGMPWTEPAERMREFVLALKAIWDDWCGGAPLDFRGEHYRHTLMTPMFRPARHRWGPPPVHLAAVGPRMTRVATEVADGVLLHSFSTVRHLGEHTLPGIEAGLAEAARPRRDFTVSFPGLVATGACDEELERSVERVRAQVAFYAATPAYRSVLATHAWEDLHLELHRLSVAGEWDAMTGLVDDEVLEAFAVVGRPHEAGAEILRRYGDRVDRFTVSSPTPLSLAVRRELLAGIRGTAAVK
jgi:probable F420-dependent oxidoreductase